MLREFLSDLTNKNEQKKALYQCIHVHGSISKKELLSLIKVPQTTMSRWIRELKQKDLITESGVGTPNGGRPPVLYTVNACKGSMIGIDIARTHVGIVLMDVKFQLLEEYFIPIKPEHTPTVVITYLISQIHKLLQIYPKRQLLGIGIGAVGPIDRKAGIILHPDAFLANGWSQVPIVTELKKEFQVPITLNNGADTAAIAEYDAQPDQPNKLLYCISGYGIRCSVIQDGVSLHRHIGDTSSFGHQIIDIDGRKCVCGKKGCLSAYATLDALFEQLKEHRLPTNMDELYWPTNPKTEHILQESAQMYGIGIANMINLLHPDTVILQGKLINHHEAYYQQIITTANNYTYQPSRKTSIRKSQLGKKGSAIGAGMEVFRQFFNSIDA